MSYGYRKFLVGEVEITDGYVVDLKTGRSQVRKNGRDYCGNCGLPWSDCRNTCDMPLKSLAAIDADAEAHARAMANGEE